MTACRRPTMSYGLIVTFAKFGPWALWNWRNLEHPTITQVLVVADSLRVEGDLEARKLAAEIEEVCRAGI